MRVPGNLTSRTGFSGVGSGLVGLALPQAWPEAPDWFWMTLLCAGAALIICSLVSWLAENYEDKLPKIWFELPVRKIPGGEQKSAHAAKKVEANHATAPLPSSRAEIEAARLAELRATLISQERARSVLPVLCAFRDRPLVLPTPEDYRKAKEAGRGDIILNGLGDKVDDYLGELQEALRLVDQELASSIRTRIGQLAEAGKLELCKRNAILTNLQLATFRLFSRVRNQYIHDVHSLTKPLSDIIRELDDKSNGELSRHFTMFSKEPEAAKRSFYEDPHLWLTIHFLITLSVMYGSTKVPEGGLLAGLGPEAGLESSLGDEATAGVGEVSDGSGKAAQDIDS